MLRFCFAFLLSAILSTALLGQDQQFIDDWMKGANSPGSVLTLKETGRNTADGRTIVSYRLFATGLTKGQHFTLWVWNLGSKPEAVADAFINPGGMIVNRLADATRKVTEDPIDIRASAGLGERKRFALTSDDWGLQAFVETLPFPIEKTVNGCRLSVEMSAPNYTAVVLHGSGFPPSNPLSVEFFSGPEGGKQQTATSPEGKFTTVIVPAVKGQSSGKAGASVTIPKCSVAVEFPWGEGSYKIQ